MGILIFGLLSLFFGICIMLLNYFLNKEDPYIKKIENMLPGFNCGACGFPSCYEMAKNLEKNKDDVNKCKPIKKEDSDILIKFLKG